MSSGAFVGSGVTCFCEDLQPAAGNSPKVESPKTAGPTTDGTGAGGPRHRMKDAVAKARKDLREGAEKVAEGSP